MKEKSNAWLKKILLFVGLGVATLLYSDATIDVQNQLGTMNIEEVRVDIEKYKAERTMGGNGEMKYITYFSHGYDFVSENEDDFLAIVRNDEYSRKIDEKKIVFVKNENGNTIDRLWEARSVHYGYSPIFDVKNFDEPFIDDELSAIMIKMMTTSRYDSAKRDSVYSLLDEDIVCDSSELGFHLVEYAVPDSQVRNVFEYLFNKGLKAVYILAPDPGKFKTALDRANLPEVILEYMRIYVGNSEKLHFYVYIDKNGTPEEFYQTDFERYMKNTENCRLGSTEVEDRF